MSNEYVIWGIPPEGTEEAILYTLAETLAEANRVMEVLTANHGITMAHIQTIDFSDDLAKMWKNPKLINLG